MSKKIKKYTRRYVVYLFNVFMPKWLCRIAILFSRIQVKPTGKLESD